jgi:16S rRNA (guanine(966)-N(2))-methyltransferase RsmD
MDNRRPPAPQKPYSPRKFYDKNNNSSPPRYGGYQNRDGGAPAGGDRFQNRDGANRFQNRENGDRFQNRDQRERFPNREGGGFQNRDARPGDGRDFRGGPRDNRDSRPPRDNYPRGGGKFVPGGVNKFAPKGRFPNKGKSFKPWQKEDNIKIVSDLQITDGKHKGKYLQSSASPNAVPTPRRIREIMFKILFRRVRAGRFLDLCAGSGTIGIEAISRGAIISTFVERSSKMCSFIKKNLESCNIKTGHGEVVEMEVLPFLKRMAKRRRFWDVVYLDANNEGLTETLEFLKRGTVSNRTARSSYSIRRKRRCRKNSA